MWLAPERFPETYRLDDVPPAVEAIGPAAVRVTHPGDALGFVTSLEVRLDGAGTGVEVAHRACNRGPTARRVGGWGLTIVRPGGVAVLPLPPFRPHPDALEPAAALALWPYAALDDPRVRWGAASIEVRNEPARPAPWKIGSSGPRGWCAYAVDDVAFVKAVAVQPAAEYPDRGCAVEVFTAGAFCELETLGPLATVPPGGELVHVERWSLVRVAPAAPLLDQLAAAVHR